MAVKWRISRAIVGSLLVVAPTAVVLAQPQATACALINYRGLDEVATGILASSDVPIGQRLDFVRLYTLARFRIANTFGAPRAAPVIVVASTEALRQHFPGASSYASTIFVPFRACVIVGPNGHDVNILAHEQLHAEIHHRVGHWYRLRHIPTWFDEGLAMQVDFRERYVWSLQSGAVDSGTVRLWISKSQFFSGDDEELTRHYAMAKEEVRLWVQEVGRENVYGFLGRVRRHERFMEQYQQKE